MPRYGSWLITERQRVFIYELAEEIGMSLDVLADDVDEEYNCTVNALTRREASALIDDLLERKQTMRR